MAVLQRGVAPRLGELSPGGAQQDGESFGPGDDREEVAVATPAWDDVLVQVRRDAGTGDRALVHAQVEPVWGGNLGESADRLLGQLSDLGRLFGSELDVVAD